MKKTLLIFMALTLCAVLSGTAQGVELKAKPNACEYNGVVKMVNPNRITVETQAGLKEFYFTHDGKKECLSFEELKVEDNVSVSCKEKKDRIEATCVKKIPVGTTLKGVTGTGVEIH